MLPTPDTSHVSFENVYEPAEDSFLFLDTLSSAAQVDFLTSHFGASTRAQHVTAHASPLVVEIGPGSGVVLAFVAANASAILGRPDVLTLGLDVNVFACRATSRTVISHVGSTAGAMVNPCLGAVTASLASSLRSGSVDLLLFNPPYVPSEALPSVPEASALTQDSPSNSSATFERDNNLLALATDGGADGMEVTYQLLDQLSTVLSPRGVAFVLLCAKNRPEQVKAHIMGWNDMEHRGKWDVQTVGSSGKTGGWEKLQIVRIQRLDM